MLDSSTGFEYRGVSHELTLDTWDMYNMHRCLRWKENISFVVINKIKVTPVCRYWHGCCSCTQACLRVMKFLRQFLGALQYLEDPLLFATHGKGEEHKGNPHVNDLMQDGQTSYWWWQRVTCQFWPNLIPAMESNLGPFCQNMTTMCWDPTTQLSTSERC